MGTKPIDTPPPEVMPGPPVVTLRLPDGMSMDLTLGADMLQEVAIAVALRYTIEDGLEILAERHRVVMRASPKPVQFAASAQWPHTAAAFIAVAKEAGARGDPNPERQITVPMVRASKVVKAGAGDLKRLGAGVRGKGGRRWGNGRRF